MTKWDDMKAATAEHMEHPRVGDRFHEMYSFWVHVVAVEPRIEIECYTATPKPPEKRTYATVDDFKRAWSYGSIPGYTVQYCDNLLETALAAVPAATGAGAVDEARAQHTGPGGG